MLDGFLQSLSPFIISTENEASFASAFAEMIASQVLPKEQLFDVRDFMVFKEVGISCKELSVEEIDECLSRLKKEILSELNPLQMTTDDKKKLAYWFQKYFVEHRKKHGILLGEKDQQIENLQTQIAHLQTKLEQDSKGHTESETSLRKRIQDLENAEIAREQARAEQLKLEEKERQETRILLKSLLVLIISIIPAFSFARMSVEKWNGYFMYIKDGSWISYPLHLLIALLVIWLWLGKEAYQSITNFLKTLFGSVKS